MLLLAIARHTPVVTMAPTTSRLHCATKHKDVPTQQDAHAQYCRDTSDVLFQVMYSFSYRVSHITRLLLWYRDNYTFYRDIPGNTESCKLRHEGEQPCRLGTGLDAPGNAPVSAVLRSGDLRLWTGLDTCMPWSAEKLAQKRANSARLAGQPQGIYSGKQKAAMMRERRAADRTITIPDRAESNTSVAPDAQVALERIARWRTANAHAGASSTPASIALPAPVPVAILASPRHEVVASISAIAAERVRLDICLHRLCTLLPLR